MMTVKMVSVTVTIIVTLALSRCQGFMLRLTPEFIDTQITEKVTLTCLPGDRTYIDGDIISMRILKGEKIHWKVIAEMENNKTDITVYEKNLLSSGHIRNLNDSYLTITWKFVTVSILGTYRCVVQGFKTNGDSIMETSQATVISERNATIQNVLFLIKEEKENNEDELKSMSKRIENINELLQNPFHQTNNNFNDHEEKIGELEKSMRNVTMFMEESSMRDDTIEEKMTSLHNFMKENLTHISQKCDLTEAVTKNLTKTLVQMSSVVESLVTKMQAANQTGTKQLWPHGYYGLMATSEGCPVNDSNIWVSGYYKSHTESSIGTNHDQISPNNHFLQPVRETYNNQNFIYQHFCTRITSRSNYYWPEGSYCINKYTSECPHSFNSGFIKWDNEDSNPSSSSNGSVPRSEIDSGVTMIFYCCRSDGSAGVPVYLPKDKPFYLYRYKGQCQQVYGMSSTEEFILFDTENSNNADKYGSDVHPDGQAKNDVRLELCYYSPI